jgi:ribosome assembly protein YihI (activator of Der GTPase)
MKANEESDDRIKKRKVNEACDGHGKREKKMKKRKGMSSSQIIIQEGEGEEAKG